ncbi:Chaperone protein dnaJ [Zostera marina]|uniref:Chaperone protein dnaJ n=1 Tax=Zostera marina TaxID=29655 RepID=A0A0K9PAW8_ZOSMR|nr:Chaperone protein dnaJ [Zostera marina]
MECNKDEALRAKEVAENKFKAMDIIGAKKFALKAQNLYPALEGISQMITTLDVHLCAASEIMNGEKDWYGILVVNASADDEMVRKQYRKLALILHPDKNKSVGAEAAFKFVSEAWSVLSDRARRTAYDQKRRIHQQKSHTVSNGFHHSTKHKSSNMKSQMNNTHPSVPDIHSSAPPRPSTFWTSCNRCKMQYEYLRVYLNHNLLCPSCHEPFLAIETGNPSNGHNNTVIWPSAHQQQASKNRNSHSHSKKPLSKAGPGGSLNPIGASFSTQGANLHHRMYYNKVTKHWEETRVTDILHRKTSIPKRTDSAVHYGNSKSNVDSVSGHDCAGNDLKRKYSADNESKDFGFNTVLQTERNSYVSGSRMAGKQSGFINRELSSFDIRNMLTETAKVLVRDKLDEWCLTVVAKSAEKSKTELRKKVKMNEKEEVKEDSTSPEDASVSPFENKTDKFRNHVGHTSIFVTNAEKASSDTDDPQPMSIDVPDPDFHDFDKDRSEKSFEADQVWATYDDEDGMPRFYCLIQKVISLKPFKCRMTFLNSRTNIELGPLNWIGMGFAKTCGDFRVSRYEVNDFINIFSHKVKFEKGPRGIIKILPQKGDTWALYRNWSPDWNEHTPDDVIHKYDMVEVLDEYNEEQGVTITSLVKVEGFKTVFRRHPDPKEVKRIPREEMFRFSHRVPSYLLTGMESENAPEGCHELDPAATPLELLQVATNAKEEGNGETSEKKTVT